ncbi:MAG: acetyl-CoA C-acyltransferase [Bacteroidota bacterium]|nr:acetyl-CoA C-acyltransferase [Bacteroidota bacterium]
MTREVYIVGAKRTPLGSFNGTLSSVPATQLGSVAIKAALEHAGVSANEVNEVIMGNVLQAGVGQAPARQASKFAEIPDNVPATTINKVCASGMKSIALGMQSIQLGYADVVVAGGMESMSLAPHYLPKSRTGYKYGNFTAIDGIVHDGLTDVYSDSLMGVCAETCASEYNFSREEQDAFAIESYERSANAWKSGKFNNEIAPVTISTRKGDITVDEDEEYTNVRFDKIPSLRPVFKKDGTVTAANASTINDGAAAMVLVSGEKLKELGLTPLAKISGIADAEQAPEWFTTSPSAALPIAVKRAGIEMSDLDAIELNEAFSVVGLANIKLMNLDPTKTNINGGAVSLGHPLGASGARIMVTLLNVLKQNGGKFGGASICNGGGGASAMVIENI